MKRGFLLSRNTFRDAVFARDNHQCVLCGATEGLDAHHIIERRLWKAAHEFGGYFLDNGATLCGVHHLEAEQTLLSCETVRERAGIATVLLPEHFYRDQTYDKWGNIVLVNGTRLKGELFFEEPVQKVLAAGGLLSLFSDRVKYPRTYHLPWSHATSDDKTLPDVSPFVGREVVVTEKMDGENTTLYRDHIHARSLELATGEDRAYVKALWSQAAPEIPNGWRVCGENVYAKHSIKYTQLPSYFLVFSVWNERNECLSWDETEEWTQLLGFQTVPVLYRGLWDEKRIRAVYEPNREPDLMEGYVVRVADRFSYAGFRESIAKFVRPNHVTSNNHWRHTRIVPNELAS
jgi:hypothetical protein